MIAQYTDREFLNFFCEGLRFGSAEANAKAFFSLMTEAASDSKWGSVGPRGVRDQCPNGRTAGCCCTFNYLMSAVAMVSRACVQRAS